MNPTLKAKIAMDLNIQNPWYLTGRGDLKGECR
jgi:hypothetical protein